MLWKGADGNAVKESRNLPDSWVCMVFFVLVKSDLVETCGMEYACGMESLGITLLCRVVDNYGDIGFVYRLSRSLSEKWPGARLTLVVSNLESFSRMARGVNPLLAVQEFNGWTVLDWNNAAVCTDYYLKNPPELILECFQCGRPEWLDGILFAPGRTETVQIVNVEYLTAEAWADEFHLLKGGTRSALVKKVNFMPGFTERTGGLVLDREFLEDLRSSEAALRRLGGLCGAEGSRGSAAGAQEAVTCPRVAVAGARATETVADSLEAAAGAQKDVTCPRVPAADSQKTAAGLHEVLAGNSFTVLVFAYNRDFVPEVRALAAFAEKRRRSDPEFTLTVLLADGLAREPFERAWEECGKPFEVFHMPYLEQTEWDAVLTLVDAAFVRGEDSFSRASLAGRFFVWHAYAQDENYHLVKVQAFLVRLEPFFADKGLFADFCRYWMLYNVCRDAPLCAEAADAWKAVFCSEYDADALEPALCGRDALLLRLLESEKEVSLALRGFSERILSLGDLTEHLAGWVQECMIGVNKEKCLDTEKSDCN